MKWSSKLQFDDLSNLNILWLFEMEYKAQQKNVKWAFGICNASPSFPPLILTGLLSKVSKESESKIMEASWH